MVLLTLGVVSAEIIPAGDEHIEIKSKYRLNGGNWVEGSPIVNIDKNDEIELTVEVKVKKLWGKNNHRLSLLDLDRDSIGPDPLYTVIKEPDYVRGNVYTFCDDDNDDGLIPEFIKWIIFWVITKVFPLPGPAIIICGPLTVSIAFFWSSVGLFSIDIYLSVILFHLNISSKGTPLFSGAHFLQ